MIHFHLLSRSPPARYRQVLEKEALSTRIHRLFDLRRDESRLVTGLFLHYFFQGFALALMIIIANAQFLSNHPIHRLPVVYMLAAVVLLLFGRVYAWLEHKLDLKRLFFTIALIILCLSLSSWAGFSFIDSAYISFGLIIAYRVIYLLANLEFWGLSATLFDVRQSKRLFGLISAGDVPAKLLGYLSASLLTPIIGIQNILLISTISFLLSVLVMNRVMSQQKLHTAEHEGHGEHHRHERGGHLFQQFFGSKLVVMLALLSAIAMISMTVIDYAFLSGVKLRFHSDAELARFLGFFFALGSAITIIIKLFLSGRVVNKYGVIRALLVLPVLLLIVSIAIIISNYVSVTGFTVFVMFGILMMISEVFSYALHNPVFLAMFQPLDLHRRLQGHTTIKGLTDPISLGIAGIILYYLFPPGTAQQSDLVFISYLFLASVIVWILTLLLVRKNYFETLKSAIYSRFLGTAQVQCNDKGSIAILRDKLKSSYPEDVIYALELMRQSGVDHLHEILQQQLSSDSEVVRGYSVKLVEEQQCRQLLPNLLDLIRKESSVSVRRAAILAYCRLAGEAHDVIIDLLGSANLDLRAAAICGLIETGGIEEIVLSGESLLALVGSESEREKLAAIKIISDLKIGKFYKPLLRFFDDDSIAVRKAVISAAGVLGSERLLPSVLKQREDRRLYQHALEALPGFGSAVIPVIRDELQGQDESNCFNYASLISTVGKIDTPDAIGLLEEQSESHWLCIRDAVLSALYSRKYHAEDHKPWMKSIHYDLALAYNINGSLRFLEPVTDNLVIDALNFEVDRTLKRMLTTLSFIYSREALERATRGIQSEGKERRANAIETLDNVLPHSLCTKLLPLVEKHDVNVFDSMIDRYATVEYESRDDVFKQILATGNRAFHAWTLTACLYQTRGAMSKEREIYMHSPHLMLRQTAQLSGGYNLDMKHQNETNGHSDLLEIEKVIILKSTVLFTETPEEILVEVAQILKPVRFVKGEVIFEKGDYGDKMYIIYEGEVSIHDGDHELSTLGRRDFFGELALLDPEPRSASATASSDCLLLELEQTPFYELMAERNEVSNGIMKVLARRIREDNMKIMELSSE
jgi:HEAT repeat protein